MSDENITLNYEKIATFKILKTLFICGYLMNIILNFVPSIEVSHRSMFAAIEVQKETYSVYEIIRLLGESEEFGWQILLVTLFALNIIFVILAIKVQKRRVFISGASITVFFLLWLFFTPVKEGIVYAILTRILGYVSNDFVLLGFLAKPTINSLQDNLCILI